VAWVDGAQRPPASYNRWAEAERKLKETPMLLKLASGIIQQSPWLAIANKQLELMSKFMSELGLSPVSRSRVQTTPLGLNRALWRRARLAGVGPRRTGPLSTRR
jgi:hypothetical protein